ncbi:MAG TPA: hypothetical protein VL754_08750 [Verrucomicrobiae bacterium]|jgi:hypothetical protein|nr:hypothetical protein [Verrucomicrobiae bacterium]
MSAKIALWITVLSVITLFVALTVRVTRAVDAQLSREIRGTGWVAETVRGIVGED